MANERIFVLQKITSVKTRIMEASPHPVVLKYGLISGLLSVLFFSITAVTGLEGTGNVVASGLVGILSFVASIVIPVIGVRFHRNIDLGGYITFAQAFAVCFGIVMIGMLIGNLGQYFYTSFVDPYYYDNLSEQMLEMFEKLNVPESDAEAALEEIKNTSTLPGIAKNFLKGSIIMVFVASIIAAIMKKNPGNPFEQNKPSGEL